MESSTVGREMDKEKDWDGPPGEYSNVHMTQSGTSAQIKAIKVMEGRAECPVVPLPPKTLAEEEVIKRRLFRAKNLHGGLLSFKPRTKGWVPT